MTHKPVILMIVQSDLFVRNYFETDALDALKKNYDCVFAYSSKISNITPVLNAGQKAVMYSHDSVNTKLQMKFYKLMTWRFRHKSSSFLFRSNRENRPKGVFKWPVHKHFPNDVKWISSFIGAKYRKFKLRILASKFVFPLIFRKFLKQLKPNTDLEQIIEQTNPSLIIIPTSAYDPDANSAMLVAQRLGIQTLCLIDNWDNLSSKSTMWIKPDHLAVWGEQSARHAVEIQDFDKDDVTLIGTPRFSRYFLERDQEIASKFDHPYLLFLGTSLAFDEAGALVRLDQIIGRNPDIFAQAKVIYRPHPWRAGKDTIVGMNLKNVTIDPQVAQAYTRQRADIKFQPSLDYYPSLLKNADLVLGGLTSMIIEALIFGQRYIAFTHDDGVNFTNQKTVFKHSEHFRGLEKVKLIDLCDDLDKLEKLVLNGWRSRGTNIKSADSDRQYFLYHDDTPFNQRLANLVSKLTGK